MHYSASSHFCHPLMPHLLTNSASEKRDNAAVRARSRIARSSSGGSVKMWCNFSAYSCGVVAWKPERTVVRASCMTD